MGNRGTSPRRIQANRNRDNIEFVQQFFQNNDELRQMGLVNMRQLPIVRKAKMKKTKTRSIHFDVIQDIITLKDKCLTILHSCPIKVSIISQGTFNCSTGQIILLSNSIEHFHFFEVSENNKSDILIDDILIGKQSNAIEEDKIIKSFDLAIKVSRSESENDFLLVLYSLKSLESIYKFSEKFLISEGIAYSIRAVFDQSTNQSSLSSDHLNEDGRICVVCFGNKVDCLILPCRHFIICYSCTKTLRGTSTDCPMCREKIDSFVKLYSK